MFILLLSYRDDIAEVVIQVFITRHQEFINVKSLFFYFSWNNSVWINSYSSYLQLLQKGTWRSVTVIKDIPSSFPPPYLMGNVVCPKTGMPSGNYRRNCLCTHIMNAFQRCGSLGFSVHQPAKGHKMLRDTGPTLLCRQLLNGTHTSTHIHTPTPPSGMPAGNIKLEVWGTFTSGQNTDKTP